MKKTYSHLLHFLHTIEGWLSDHEGELLYQFARLSPSNATIVEIGSWKGKSTICLAFGLQEGLKNGKIFAIDPHKGIISNRGNQYTSSFPEFQSNISHSGLSHYVQSVRKTSVDAEKLWDDRLINVLFLDSLHDEFHTFQDYSIWRKHVSSSGVIAFHDGFCGEKGVWNAIQKGPFQHNRVIDIGTVGSILYFCYGKPTMYSSFTVAWKKMMITLATSIQHLNIPIFLKTICIHRIIRLMLWSSYTNMVYSCR